VTLGPRIKIHLEFSLLAINPVLIALNWSLWAQFLTPNRSRGGYLGTIQPVTPQKITFHHAGPSFSAIKGPIRPLASAKLELIPRWAVHLIKYYSLESYSISSSSNPLLVTMTIITQGVTNPPTLVARQEIRTFAQDKELMELYLLALERFQKADQNDPLSWYQVAGIHGRYVCFQLAPRLLLFPSCFTMAYLGRPCI
jgi:hypothetical protein